MQGTEHLWLKLVAPEKTEWVLETSKHDCCPKNMFFHRCIATHRSVRLAKEDWAKKRHA
jgi:hypothetical protein